jgi:hypothetical protein
MLSNKAYEYMENLQYRVKDLTEQVKQFKSGEKYQAITDYYDNCLALKDQELRKIKLELANTRAQYVDVRNNWQEVHEDMEEEYSKELAKKERANKALWRQLVKKQDENDSLRQKLQTTKEQYYKALIKLEEEKGKTLKLKAQINRDYETSGIPSSMKPNHKKITNNREKTGRKPGGQLGHKGHHRKQHEPTSTVEIPVSNKLWHPDYKETGRVITKQLVDLQINLVVTEWATPEFRDMATGQRLHADFPEGIVNEVTYGGGVKALAFLVKNHCNVSVMKTSDLLCELTMGKLRLSAGMINNLAKDFSKKTQAEQKKSFADMLLAPTMYTDFTTARVNGKNHAVLVCANDTHVIYFAKENKGHKGIKGTPVETYQGVLVHDHDKTFYSYGSNHQECLEHIRRYLKDSMINEPHLKWNSQMRQLINEMIGWKRSIDCNDNRNPDQIDPEKVIAFETRYDEILNLSAKEYEYEPPSKYYPEGFNLYKRLLDYRANHLLFLHDKNVDPTNNLSERLLRNFKRKQHQVISFRSHEGLSFACDSLGVVASFVKQDTNLFQRISNILSPTLNTISSSI